MLDRARTIDAVVHSLTTPAVLTEHEVQPTLEVLALQVKERINRMTVKRQAKNCTKPEFIWHLDAIIAEVHQQADKAGLQGHNWRFVFDNPSNHNVKREDLKNLRPGDVIEHPPRYSPEIMQPIEHSHGWTVNEYEHARLLHGVTEWDLHKEWGMMLAAFKKQSTPTAVKNTVARVPEAAKQIVLAKGGRIPKMYP